MHDVPQLNTTRAYGACAANVLVPGSGTMYAALQSEDQNIRETQALVGLLKSHQHVFNRNTLLNRTFRILLRTLRL